METFTPVGRATIHYISLGAGAQTLIFLHGWTASVREWLPFASELSDYHRVVCWDARGHGAHNHDDSIDMSIAAMADDLAELLAHLEITDAVLIGHSMGALTAWEYIRRHGEARLSGLCILDQSPKLVTNDDWQHGVYGAFTRQHNERFLSRLQADFPEGVLELIAFGYNERSRDNYLNNSRGFQQMREHYQTLPAALLTACWRDITQQDYRDVLGAISVPTLLVYGDQSQFYSQALQQWVLSQIPHAKLTVYENADHSPHLWHRERFIYDLNRFVEGL